MKQFAIYEPEVEHRERPEPCTCWGCEQGRQAREQTLTWFGSGQPRLEELAALAFGVTRLG